MKKYLPKTVFHVLLVLLVGVLSACNDDKDDNNPSASTLSGTAAVGAAMSGTVTAVGANGNTESITLAADGTFTINSSSLNFPVLVKADNGAGTVLYSWALSRNQKANITPLTTLALVLSGLPDNLDNLFSNWAGSASAMDAGNMTEAQAIVNANLQAQLASAGIDYTNYDFLKTPFSADSTGIDAALDALDFTFTFSGSNFASIVDIKLAGTSTPVVFDENIDISAITVGGSSAFIPSITTFAPASGATGTTVTINGNGFDEDKFHMTVSFSNNVAAEIVSSSKTELVVTVPAGAVSGPLTVTHGISGQRFTSSARFTVTTDGGGGSSDWTARDYGSAFMLKSIAYSGSTFAAVGFNNTIVTSTDGITWTARSAPDNLSYTINSVIWDGAQFVAVGDVVFGAPEGTDPLIATSPDGITWTRRNWDGIGASLVDVTIGKGHLTAVGPSNIISSTDNGATWTEDTLPTLSTGSIGSFTGVASATGIRVAVGKDSSNKGLILVSTSCCSWTEVSSAMSDFHPYQVIANGNQFVAMGAANANFGAKPVIQTSSDGSTWTTQTLPASIADSGYSLLDGAWTGNRYIVVGNNGALASERIILSSTDGVSWEVDKKWATSGRQNMLSGVASSSTLAITVGDSMFSKDIGTP